jgi:hypothetical protein
MIGGQRLWTSRDNKLALFLAEWLPLRFRQWQLAGRGLVTEDLAHLERMKQCKGPFKIVDGRLCRRTPSSASSRAKLPLLLGLNVGATQVDCATLKIGRIEAVGNKLSPQKSEAYGRGIALMWKRPIISGKQGDGRRVWMSGVRRTIGYKMIRGQVVVLRAGR